MGSFWHERLLTATLIYIDAENEVDLSSLLNPGPHFDPSSVRDAGKEDFMNILLLSMPDSFEHMPTVAIRMPNGALTSLAGNVDAHHRVAVADLILVQDRVRETIDGLVRKLQPDVVGLSVM